MQGGPGADRCYGAPINGRKSMGNWGYFTQLKRAIVPFITGRGPPCRFRCFNGCKRICSDCFLENVSDFFWTPKTQVIKHTMKTNAESVLQQSPTFFVVVVLFYKDCAMIFVYVGQHEVANSADHSPPRWWA